jgi:hypothetical protein
MSVTAFLVGMAVFAIFQAAGLSLGTLGILTMLWLSQMAVVTASLIYVLLCETSIRSKPPETSQRRQRTGAFGSVIWASRNHAPFALGAASMDRSSMQAANDDHFYHAVDPNLYRYLTDPSMEALDFRRLDS